MVMENEDRTSDSPYIERVYRSKGVSPVKRMHSVANSNWELVIWEHCGRAHVAIRGPETRPTTVDMSPDGSAFGIIFAHGAAMPHLPVQGLVDSAVLSPHVTSDTFVLQGEEWELPGFDNAEVFVDRLVRSGILMRDPLVTDVVAGDDAPRLSARSVQRRVVAATGLTQGAIRQIERAREAAMLLGEGVAPLDVVHRLGYYDQPHLARSLTRFMGRTATELQHPDPDEPLSLLYKSGQ
ncbi:helix-turn-helix domain-containing protein [Nonomuraea sp. NPDC049625]|uniref:helix-turn-helix domain-containing protein n=1 Tax=Nonomuraea sp. NPDC049625 TaxID=3155775 RepID=UPI0034198D06